MGKNQRIRQWRFSFGCLSLVALMAASCANDDHSGTGVTVQAITQWCSSLCDWSRACGRSVSTSCERACQMQDGFVGGGGRVEFFETMTDCLARDPRCTGGEDASWAACAEKTALATPLTQTAYDFCAEMGQRFFECGYSMAPDTCARSFIYLNDATLLLAGACSKTSCEQLEDCIANAASGQGA